MAPQRERLVRRRRDGIVQIRRRGPLRRAVPVLRDVGTALAIVLVGTVAYTVFLVFIFVFIGLLAVWAVRALWRELEPARAALRRRPRPPLVVLEGRRAQR
jgi:hypothetical protein